MRRIVVNGHGWSGSSAFIDFLDSIQRDDYSLIPGEFDDFRVPGTMRELIEQNRKPVSKRVKSNSYLAQLFLRSMVPNGLWPSGLRGKSIDRDRAGWLFKSLRKEKRNFLKYQNLVGNDPRRQLSNWFDDVCEAYAATKPGCDAIFIEQFFLFDDCFSLYDWFDFDSLVLFIRNPINQIASTLESSVLYSNYPWQAEFLIGSGKHSQNRKFALFLNTTIERYHWVIEFLKNVEPEKVVIVDFDDFLFKNDRVVTNLSRKLSVDLTANSNVFDLDASVARNKTWASGVEPVDRLLEEANAAFAIFKSNLQNNYEVV